jgi:hypothetical protein
MPVTTATNAPAGTYSIAITGDQPDHHALDKRLALPSTRRHGELQPLGAVKQLVHESGLD